MALLSLSVLVFIGAYGFYGYELFSKEGFDGITFRLFFSESLLFFTGFAVISLTLKHSQFRFALSFLLIAIVPILLSVNIMLRHHHTTTLTKQK